MNLVRHKRTVAHMNLSVVGAASALPARPFTASELSELSIKRYDLRVAVERGEILRPFRGVFIPSDVEDTAETRAAAVSRVVSPHHVVSDRTAAWIHGINTYSLSEQTQIPAVETCARRGYAPTRLEGVDGRSRDLLDRDIMTINGVKITTPLRTALDLVCNLKRREAMAALNEFAKEHGITRAALNQELPRFKGRRGVVQLRELVPLLNRHVESQRESWTLLAISDAGLPLPETQVWVDVEGIPTYRLDFAYRLAKVAVEYDGEDHDDPDQRIYDEERRGWLVDHGWIVIIVRRGDFTGDRLDAWLREIKDALTPTYSSRRF